MKKTAFPFSTMIIIVLVLVIIVQYVILLSHDTSMQPIPKSSFKPKEGVHLVTYADGPDVFKQNRNTLVQSSLNKGIDFIYSYGPQHLEPNFAEQNKEILQQTTGVGYWLWKPWVILNTLEKIPENAILIYADTPIVFRRPVTQLVELTEQHPIILIEHPSLTREQETQKVTMEGLGCTSKECRQGNNCIAGFMILKNTAKTRAFIKEWLADCQVKKYLVDIDSNGNEFPHFIQHKHDQSILSILAHHQRQDVILLPYKFLCDNFISITYRKPKTAFKTQDTELYKYSLLGRLESKVSNTPMFISLRRSIFSNVQKFPWRDNYYKKFDIEKELVAPT